MTSDARAQELSSFIRRAKDAAVAPQLWMSAETTKTTCQKIRVLNKIIRGGQPVKLPSGLAYRFGITRHDSQKMRVAGESDAGNPVGTGGQHHRRPVGRAVIVDQEFKIPEALPADAIQAAVPPASMVPSGEQDVELRQGGRP